MLDTLEMLIAFAVVMLGVSLLITILTQIVSTLFGARGTNLRWGLVQLISTIHPEFQQSVGAIVDKVLTHPLISDSAFSRFRHIPLLARWRLASAIRVEELVGILEKLSAGVAPLPVGITPPAEYTIEQAMATIVRDARAKAGLELQTVAAEVRQFLGAVTPAAAAAGAGGGTAGKTLTAETLISTLQPTVKLDELIGKIPAAAKTALDDLPGWFHSAMDRASQRFALQMRVWTIAFAILLAFALQLDSFHLLARLSTDAKLRAGLAASYAAMSENAAKVTRTPDNKPTIEELTAQAKLIRTQLDEAGFKLIPNTYGEWDIWPGIKFDNPRFWGILFSAALLSLGAPFWFNALKSLSNLRPLLANRESAERGASAAKA